MDIDTTISTSSLFHYTYSQENLLKILENGFQPRYSLEKLGILKKVNTRNLISEILNIEVELEEIIDEFAIPMCCFCDIPLNLVDNHIKIYGEYAIGLKKEWGEKNAICPVLYLPNNGETQVLFEELIRNYKKNLSLIYSNREQKLKAQNIKDELLFIEIMNFYNILFNLTMYVKPYKGIYERKNFFEENYKFYDEREWRYKPYETLCKPYMTKEEYNSFNSSEQRNENMGYIDFEPHEITDIIVPESEVDAIKEIVSKMTKYKEFDLKKINSLNEKKNYSAQQGV